MCTHKLCITACKVYTRAGSSHLNTRTKAWHGVQQRCLVMLYNADDEVRVTFQQQLCPCHTAGLQRARCCKVHMPTIWLYQNYTPTIWLCPSIYKWQHGHTNHKRRGKRGASTMHAVSQPDAQHAGHRQCIIHTAAATVSDTASHHGRLQQLVATGCFRQHGQSPATVGHWQQSWQGMWVRWVNLKLVGDRIGLPWMRTTK